MKVILWRRPDGGFSFTVPAGETDDQARAYAAVLLEDPHHVGYVLEGVCDETELPDGGRFNKTNLTAAEFKGAWECAGGKPVVSMDKAREIQRERLRVERKPLLAALDVEYLRALEAGDVAKSAKLVEQKQQLRDITADPRLVNATSIEELKVVALPEA